MITIYISKSDSNLQVDWDAMPEPAKNHIIEYGLRQKLNDAGSSATAKELGKDEAGKQALAMAEVVLEALMQGKVTVRQASAGLTLEERMFNKVLKAIYKKTVGKVEEGESVETLLTTLAAKLGKDVQAVKVALEKKATVESEIQRKISTLKEQTPDIEL